MAVLDRFRLDGKRMFITGGSRGLGREMALAVADAGADVVMVGRDPDVLKAAVQEIRELGRECEGIVGDVGEPEQCEGICNDALRRFGPFDILINNVGGRRKDIATVDMTLAQWRELVDLNLTCVFVCTKIIGGEMVTRGGGGRIINIASINSFVVGRGIGGRTYETSKAAVVQFTKTVAADWAPYKVTANVICPGGFFTEPNQRWARENPKVIETFRSQIPMGDLGPQEDLGPLAVYLASDASRYMTGAALVIDGGYTLW